MTSRIDHTTSHPKHLKLSDLPTPSENVSHRFPDPIETTDTPIGEVKPLTGSEANDLFTLFQNTLTVEESSEMVFDPNQYDPRKFTIRMLNDNGKLTEENRSLVMLHQDPDSLCSAVTDLFAMQIFDQELFLIISKRSNPNFITQTLLQFKQVHGLTEETFKFVLGHSDPQLLYSMIEILRGLGRFTPEAFYQCAALPKPGSLAAYLSLLIETQLPIEKYYEIAFKEIDLTYLVQVMKILKDANILTDENISIAISDPKFQDDLLQILERLIANQLMNEANYRAAFESPNFFWLSGDLYYFEFKQILNQTTYNLLINRPYEGSVAELVNTLSNGHLLTEANLEAASRHKKPTEFAKAIVLLNGEQLLSPQLYALALKHESPKEFAIAIIDLNVDGIMTDENRDLVAAHKCPRELVRGIVLLTERGGLTKENLQTVFHHQNPEECAGLLAFLASDRPEAKEPFLKEDFEVFMESPNPLSVLNAWEILNHAGILTAENKKRVLSCETGYLSMTSGLAKLHEANLLNDENVAYIIHSYYPQEAAQVLVTMQKTNLLNEENRKRISYLYLGQSSAIRNLHNLTLFDQEALEWLSSGDIAERCRLAMDLYFMDAEIFSILRNHDQPVKLANALSSLQRESFPIKDHLQLLRTHKSPESLAFGFVQLFKFVPQNEHKLPHDCYKWLAQVEGKPSSVASLYCKLHETNQLTEQNLSVLAKCENNKLEEGVGILLNAHLFNEENFKAAADHPNPSSYCNALKIMDRDGISAEYLIVIAQHKSPVELICVFSNLHKVNLLTPERAQRAAKYSRPDLLYSLLYKLKSSILLSAETWEEALVHPHILEYTEIISSLDTKEILTEETRSLAAKHPDTLKLNQAVNELEQRHKLTLENFLIIVERADPVDALALLS